MKIGNVKLENGFFLAPMANFSTPPFRRLCNEFGAGLTTSEMVSCEAVIHGNERTEEMYARARNEVPFAIQVFGSEPERIALAAEALEKKCEIIDLNLGCPARHITCQGAGAALLRTPARISGIFDALTTTRAPVTAKMRLGFGTKTKCVEIARLIERGGAAALTVHARTAKQDSSKKADLGAIRKIKEALSIPVIGNGDVIRPEDAEKMLEATGCDGVMIGRGALGNPFIFRQMDDYFRDGKYAMPGEKEKMEVFLRFLEYAQNGPVASTRMQSFYFTKGLDNAVGIRRRISATKSVGEIRKIAASAFG